MRVCVLFSGGKDSAYALGFALSQAWDVKCLLCLAPERDSLMFHHPNTKWTRLQAQAAGNIPLEVVKTKNPTKPARKRENEPPDSEARPPGSRDDPRTRSELATLQTALARLKKKYQLDVIVSGAISSEYQKQRLDQIGEELGLKTFAPIWRKNHVYAIDLLANYEIYLSAVSADGLGPEFLAARYDRALYDRISRLRPIVNPLFEGGEAETFCADAPFFRKKIVIEKWNKHYSGQAGVAEIARAKLAGK